MSCLLFLTRLDPLDDALALDAETMGFDVIRLPLLATDPGADSGSLVERLQTMGSSTALAWTSRHAAESLAGTLPALREVLSRAPMFALGDESASPLRREGFKPHTPAEGHDASDLARFIANRADEQGIREVIFLRGDRSLPTLPDGLQDAGIVVVSLEVYRTRFLNADVGGLVSSLEGGDPVAVAYFSPSCVEALERLLDEATRKRLRESAAAIARGGTTAAALGTRGHRSVFRPTGDDPFERIALDVLQTTGRL